MTTCILTAFGGHLWIWFLEPNPQNPPRDPAPPAERSSRAVREAGVATGPAFGQGVPIWMAGKKLVV